jgi:hypothetical protein
LNKQGNLQEINKFIGMYDQPILNQEDRNNFNRPIKINEIKTVTKDLPKKKSPGSYGFTD